MKRTRVNKDRSGPVPKAEQATVLEAVMASDYPINRDCEQYRAGYPKLADCPTNAGLNQNWLFYSNELRSSPNPGGTIEEILASWHGNHKLLERHHGYIQWLFPTRVQGVNGLVHPLQPHEAKAIRESGSAKTRVLAAYRMMLDFLGLRLVDEHSGALVKLPQFEARLTHILEHPHNLLRVTRIIRSVGELGWPQLQRPLVDLYLDVLHAAFPPTRRVKRRRRRSVISRQRRHQIPNALVSNSNNIDDMLELGRSCLSYWVNSVLDEHDWRLLQARAAPLLPLVMP